MIIYGSRATTVATEVCNDACTSCGTKNSVQITVYQRYAHIFWIPLFPIGKTGLSQCSHCKQVLKKKEFGANLRSEYDILKFKSKTPVWTFSGIALLSVFVLTAIIGGKQREVRNSTLIAAPQAGDVYEVKRNYKQYTLYKVSSVEGDTVFLLVNEYETNKISGLSDLKSMGDDAFDQEPMPVLKTELQEMFDNGKIIDIDRY